MTHLSSPYESRHNRKHRQTGEDVQTGIVGYVESHRSDRGSEMAVQRRYDEAHLSRWILEIFAAEGFEPDDAHSITSSLLYADEHGIESHGVQRVRMYDGALHSGRINISAKPSTVFDTPVSAVIDGHDGMGQLVAMHAMRVAIQKASTAGIGIVAVRHSGHYGTAGYYANAAADTGLIGISMTNTRPAVVPTHARTHFIGTNPIAIAAPAKPHNFLFDAATSTVPAGHVELFATLSRTMPAGWVTDEAGHPVTDPVEGLRHITRNDAGGGLLPLGGDTEATGGHKGYGFGMVVELLTGILSGGQTSDKVSDFGAGICHNFVAIDPAIFGDRESIIASFSDYLNELRALPSLPGEHVYVQGDKEMIARADRQCHGIPMSDATFHELCEISERLGVPDTYRVAPQSDDIHLAALQR